MELICVNIINQNHNFGSINNVINMMIILISMSYSYPIV